MPDYHSYLEAFNSGVYITHAHEAGDRSLCGLVVYDLIPAKRVTTYNRLMACPRCLAFVEADKTPRMQPEQMLLDWSSQDG